MGKKITIMNQAAAEGTERTAEGRFWNFLDHGDTAELQLFGTIQSEEDWWSEDCVTYRNFINELNALGDKKAIDVIIQSGGGDVFAANAIYNALAMNKAEIHGKIIGICASAATIILMACDTRRIAKNAVLMAHNPSVSLWGSYQTEELLKLAEVTEQVKKSIVTAYMERLDKTEEEISQLMDEESWYVGQEAVDAGFCDGVMETDVQNNILSNRFMMDGVSYSFTNYMEKYVPDNIRKKVQALSKVQRKDAGTFFNKKNISQKGMEKMEENDIGTLAVTNTAQLQNAYPDLCAALITDAVNAERERLKAIDEIAQDIPDELLVKAKYEEPMTAADLALAQMKANQAAGRQFLDRMAEDLAGSGVAAVGTEPNAGYDPEAEKTAEAKQKVSGFAAKLKKDKRRGKE